MERVYVVNYYNDGETTLWVHKTPEGATKRVHDILMEDFKFDTTTTDWETAAALAAEQDENVSIEVLVEEVYA